MLASTLNLLPSTIFEVKIDCTCLQDINIYISMSMYIHTYSATVRAAAELYTVGFTTALFYNNHLIYRFNKILTNHKLALLISQAFLHSVQLDMGLTNRPHFSRSL